MQDCPVNPSDAFAILYAGDARERRDAVRLLAERGDERVIPALAFAMGDGNRGVKDLAIEALIRMGGKRVAEKILPLATDRNFALRSAALEVLERIGDAAPALIIDLMDHPDPTARVNGALLVARVGIKAAARPLSRRLEDGNANVRAAALNALAAIGARDQAPLIRKALTDRDESVRFAAIHALGALADSAAVPDLVPVLKESSEACVMAAVDTLGGLKNHASVPFLMEKLASSSATLKYHILHNLVRIAESQSDLDLYKVFELHRFQALFIEALENAQLEMDKSALLGLSRIGSMEAVGPIVKHILSCGESLDGEKSRLAEEALVAIGETEPLLSFLSSVAPPLNYVPEKGIESLCRVLGRLKEKAAVAVMVPLLTGTSESMRRTVVWSLSQIGGASAQEALIQALGDPNGHVRREASAGLGQFEADDTVLALFRALDCEPYPDVRDSILTSLVRIGGSLVKEKLREFLFYPDPQIKEVAISGIAQLGDRDACDHLIASLNHEQHQIRTRVVQSLGLLESERMVGPLLHCLHDEDDEVRLAAVDVLSHKEEDRAVQGLITALRDPSRRVAYKAAEALGQIGDVHAVEPMMAVLQETAYVPLKIALVRALIKIGDPRSESVLESVLRDPNPDLQAVFLKA